MDFFVFVVDDLESCIDVIIIHCCMFSKKQSIPETINPRHQPPYQFLTGRGNPAVVHPRKRNLINTEKAFFDRSGTGLRLKSSQRRT